MIWSKSAPSQVEFRRCTVDNTTTGEAIKDDPQGQGAGFAIGVHSTLVLTDSVFLNNFCGEKVRACGWRGVGVAAKPPGG